MAIVVPCYNEHNMIRHANLELTSLIKSLINDNLIVDVVDKNEEIKYDYLWGTVLFKNTLWEFINKDDPHIGYSFKPAIENGLKLSYVVAEGRYYDCGTVDEYWEMVKEVNYEQ